jgi:hypothetical protein
MHPSIPQRIARSFAACGFAAAALLATPLAQAFCGFYAGKADANLFNEASQVIVVRDGPRTVLSMLNDYSGPLNEFALIVPTPTTLQRGQVRIADKLTFERLDAYSAPRLAEYFDSDPCQFSFAWGQDLSNYLERRANILPVPSAARPMNDVARDKALGVTVELQYTLEEYDIVSLSATQSDGLETWLRQNGYKLPKGASAALKPYINQGMKFFVAKVNLKEQRKTGYSSLRPLQFAFESEKFMLPMRLGMLNAAPGKTQDLIIYMLTKNGRVESSNYRTAKLPTGMNLPFFIKPKFQDFYKTMFGNQAKQEDHRVVFTEYFWDMAWCDPCAANPLSAEELAKAGVFWVGGNPDENFSAMQKVAPPVDKTSASGINDSKKSPGIPKPLEISPATRSITPPPNAQQAQPVVLTRLHVRYTPATFPEDLMFTQTKDRQNWQARYVLQNPYGGSVAQCSEKIEKNDCAALCQPRVEQVLRSLPESAKETSYNYRAAIKYRGKDADTLLGECQQVCESAKQSSVAVATRYYERELPARLKAEKQTLAQLTGWGLAEIDALPEAQKYSVADEELLPPLWWQRLFGTPAAAYSSAGSRP